jgi:hypothetical protein
MLQMTWWETLVSALEVMQDNNDSFSSDELYANLRCFEKKLKQAGDYTQELRLIAFSTQLNDKQYNPPTS